MNKKSAWLVVDKQGIPMVGTKVCATRTGAKNSLAPHLNGELDHRIGWDDSAYRSIHKEAQRGCGVPKLVHPDRIDDLVDTVRSKPTWSHKHGDKRVTRVEVERYNEIVKEIIEPWEVVEVSTRPRTHKVMEGSPCGQCGGLKDVRYIKNFSEYRCRICR